MYIYIACDVSRYLAGTDAGEVTLHSFREQHATRSFTVSLTELGMDEQMGVAALRFNRDGFHFASANDAGGWVGWCAGE
jgi:hypothetical protein